MSYRKRVVLVGAGHGHLEVARRGSELTDQGIRWTLIDPGKFWYSGRATAMLAGTIGPHQDQIDPGPLVAAARGHLLRGTVKTIDRRSRFVVMEDGSTLPYDVVSLNVGSVVHSPGFPGDDGQVYPVKPLSAMWEIAEHLRSSKAGRTTAVVGGGVTGCEVCACLAAMVKRGGLSHRMLLIHEGGRLASGVKPSVARKIERHLRGLGVEIHLNQRADSFSQGEVIMANSVSLSADSVILATGLQAHPISRQIVQLDSDQPDGDGLLVNDCLQSVMDPGVFAIGDCARMLNYSLPRHGVFAVRAAPVLVDNLIAACFNRELKPYVPQEKYLSIINLGDGRAMALWGELHWYGRLPMVWKEYLDRRFMQRYRLD